MILVIVILSVSFLITYVVLSRTLFPLLKKRKLNRYLIKEGTEAEATLLNMEQTGMYVNNLPQVKLQLQVQPGIGRNFVAETSEILSFIDLAHIKVGNTVRVKYNPMNNKEIMLVKQWQA